jgi:hypothetical protein
LFVPHAGTLATVALKFRDFRGAETGGMLCSNRGSSPGHRGEKHKHPGQEPDDPLGEYLASTTRQQVYDGCTNEPDREPGEGPRLC